MADDDDREPDDLSDDEIREAADRISKDFLGLFTDPMFCRSIAPRVTCREAEIVAVLVTVLGGELGTARTWLDCHIDGDDDPDDWHNIPEIPDYPPG
jgi:hypothetical protein